MSLLPLLVLLAPTCAAAPPPCQEHPTPYRNPEAGFQIAAPATDWILQASGHPGDGSFQLLARPPQGEGRVQLTVRVLPTTEPLGERAYRDALLAQLRTRPQYHAIEAIEDRIADRNAPGVALDGEAGGVRYHFLQYVLVAHGYRYLLECYAPIEEYSRFAELFSHAFPGFTFLPPSEAALEERRLAALAGRCGSEWDWASDWTEAVKRARAGDELILVYARLYPGFEMTDSVLSGPLMDEDLIARVRKHFVPMRLGANTSAPFRDPDRYGLSATTFGQAILVADPQGRILAEDSLLEVATIEGALQRGLEAAGIEYRDAKPSGSGAADQLFRIRSAIRHHDGETALKLLDTVPAAEAGARFDLLRGIALFGMGRAKEAEAWFARVGAESPSSPETLEARFRLGLCAYQRGDRKTAERCWLELAREHPDSRWAWQAAAGLRDTFFQMGLGADLSWKDPKLLAEVGWRPSEPLPLAQARRAEHDALVFLLAAQQPDGSWIGPSSLSRIASKGNDAFTVAFTALAGRALLEHPEREGCKAAARRALAFLVAAHEREKAAPPGVFFMDYSPWSKSASIQFLADCLDQGIGEAAPLRTTLSELVAELATKQRPSGGWSYYLSGSLEGAARPVPQSISFTTAAVVLALQRAQEEGTEVPAVLLRTGLECLAGMRNPNGTFEYMSSSSGEKSARGTGRPGAAGRGPVCALALYRGGRESRQDLRERLDIFLDHLDELARERGKGLMHAGRQAQGSHYLLFDYATAAETIAELPEEQREHYRKPLMAAILGARNRDGSFTDNPITGPSAGAALALSAFAFLRPLP